MGIRPIVSSCGSPTENISQFVDYRLQPHMKALPSYIKDTTQLINELRELSVEPDTFLVTIDVKSLYTCIPHSEGIQACTETLLKSKMNNPSQPNTTVLACLLEIVLKNNLFEFDGTHYKQLQGTAMGTKLAPAYIRMLTYLWASWNIIFFPTPHLSHHSTDDILMIFSSYGHTPKQTLKLSYRPLMIFTQQLNSHLNMTKAESLF